MSDTIETQTDDLYAPVSFGGGGKKSGGRNGGRKSRTSRNSSTGSGSSRYPRSSSVTGSPADVQEASLSTALGVAACVGAGLSAATSGSNATASAAVTVLCIGGVVA